MKKIVILLGLVASFGLIVGCASQDTAGQSIASSQQAAPAHPDVKGEVSK